MIEITWVGIGLLFLVLIFEFFELHSLVNAFITNKISLSFFKTLCFFILCFMIVSSLTIVHLIDAINSSQNNYNLFYLFVGAFINMKPLYDTNKEIKTTVK